MLKRKRPVVINTDPRGKQISVRVTITEYDKVKAFCKANQITTAKLLEMALNEYLQKEILK